MKPLMIILASILLCVGAAVATGYWLQARDQAPPQYYTPRAIAGLSSEIAAIRSDPNRPEAVEQFAQYLERIVKAPSATIAPARDDSFEAYRKWKHDRPQ